MSETERTTNSEGALSMTAEREVLDRLVSIETKLDVSISRVDDHEARLRRLERAVWLASGAAAVGGGFVGQLLQQLMAV